MKTNIWNSKRFLSLFLALVLVIGMLPMNILTASAATATPVYDERHTVISAKGAAITIEAGTTSGTAVWYMNGTEKTYINPNGAAGDDLSRFSIYGGGYSGFDENIATGDTSIVMRGGEVYSIVGGNSSDDLQGSTRIEIYGGTITAPQAVVAGCSSAKLSGTATLIIQGGNIEGEVRGDASSESYNSTTSYLICESDATLYTNFDHVIARKGSNWTVSGSPVIPSGITLTIDAGETLTLNNSTALTNNGSIVNNGTIYLNALLSLGNYSGSGTIVRNAAFITSANQSQPSVWMNGTQVASPKTEYVDGKWYIYGLSGNVKVTIGSQSYYGVVQANTPTELSATYTVPTAISGVGNVLYVGSALELNAAYSPENTTLPQTVSYSIVNAGNTGAELNGNVLTATAEGTLTLRVTVTDGYNSLQKDFTFTVKEADFVDVSNGDITIEEKNGKLVVTSAFYTNGSKEFALTDAIKITGTTEQYTVTVKSGSPNIILENCNITASSKPAFNIESGGKVSLSLSGSNVLTTTDSDAAALRVPEGAELTLYGPGTLNAAASNTYAHGAGIGGSYSENAGKITICSGTITASSAYNAAGIGGGDRGSAAEIRIEGGTVTASSKFGAGIGGGYWAKSDVNITITGGQVIATGNYGAAIGSGQSHDGGGSITITSGTIIANGGESNGAGIGSGYQGSMGNITISGGSVTASAYAGAAIGSASWGSVGTISISGGNVTANSGTSGSYTGAGIGAGMNGSCTAIKISGGKITASGGQGRGAGIGTGIKASKDVIVPITISGGTVTAAGGSDTFNACAAGIGGGSGNPGGNVIITGGSVKATTSYSSLAPIGPGLNGTAGTLTDGTNNVSLITITIEGITAETAVTSIKDAAGQELTYGLDDVYTTKEGILYLYLPSASVPFELVAGGTTYYGIVENGAATFTLTKPHTHSWKYEKDGANKIKAICEGSGTCSLNNDGGYVTVAQPSNLTYTGSAIEAVITNTLTTGATPKIVYSSTTDELVDGKPVYAGDYTATVSVGGKEISLDYTIAKATPTADDFVFTAPTDLTFDYTEKAYSLKVKDGIVGMGTVYVMCYRDRTEYPAKLPGDYKLQVTVGVGDNYTDAYFLKSDDWKFTISYLDTDAEAVVSGTKGSNNWYTSAVTLAAPEGYTISETVNGTYSDSVSYEAEQNKTVTYYLKDKDGYIVQRTEEIKIDLNDPTAQYKIGTDGWKQFINAISFGLFCKDYKTVEIEYSDTESGVATKQYYIASAEVTDTSKISWSDYTDTLNLNATGTYFVYMRVVDHAGREVILNSEGIVIYEDSVAVDTEVKTTYGSTNDVTVTVDLKGNTITDVKSGDQSWMTDKDACTVNGDTITLKGSYVKKLGAGTYPLTVYYAPQGVETDEVTITTTFNLVIDKAKLTVKAEDKTVTYGDAVPSYTVKYSGFVNGDGEVSLGGTLAFDCEYKQFSKVDSYTITPKGLVSNNYEFDYQNGTLTVSPKEITVTIQKATSVYGDEIAALTADDNGGIVNNDKNVYSLATTATKTSDVDTYDITGTDISDNYVVTFENGTKAYTITQRELTVTVVVANKKYDGLNNATITSAKLNNVANGDQILLSNGTATFVSVDVANGISINLTPFSISGDKVGNYKLTQPTGITASITNGWNPVEGTEYTISGSDWSNTDFTVTAKDGYELSQIDHPSVQWFQTLTFSIEGQNSATFYVRNLETRQISEMVTENYKLDKVAPTGSVEFVGREPWQEFVSTITFGLFYKDEVTVKVSADDALSGVAKIEYASADKAMTLDEVKAIANWTEYTDNFGVTLADAKKFVYFVRITDKAGNLTYLSSDGAEYDTTDPAINGVENGKTYYTTQKVTVTEKNVKSITVNGEGATTDITLDGNVDKTYTIIVTDKAENVTTVTVTMKPISELSTPIDTLNKDNVNSSNEQVVDGVKAAVAAVDTTNATEEEMAAVKAISDKAAELEKVIDDTKAEIARITEEMAKYDDATVNSDDVAALEQLGKDIKALIDAGNLTEAERTALTEDAADVAAMQKTVSDTTAENNRISDKVDDYDLATVTSDDKADLEQLLADINKQLESTHLTDEETSKLNGEKKAVEDLLTKIQGTDELIDKLTGDVDGYSDETVKSTDKDAIEQIIKDIDALLETENLTEDEEKALEDTKTKAQELLDTIDNAADATESENTEKVKEVTAENVTPEDKTDLEKAKEDLEKALEDYGDNYTEDEKKAIEEEIKRIDDALEVIGNVENVEELIDKLPDTIKKDDADVIKAADDAYNALSDYEKTLVGEDAKKALDDAKAALTELNKPNSPATGDNSNMFLWIALLFISGGAVITLTVVDRKKKAVK